MNEERTFELLCKAIGMLIDEDIMLVDIQDELGLTDEEIDIILD